MNKTMKTVLIGLLIAAAIGAAVVYKMINKKHRDVANEKGIEVTAVQLVKAYQANEADANKMYLDKTIQVSGNVAKIEKNQEGNMTVLLSSDDPFAGVYCTLKAGDNSLKENSQVVIKGFCSGMLSDVRLREAVVVK